jgi:hypothetical protein
MAHGKHRKDKTERINFENHSQYKVSGFAGYSAEIISGVFPLETTRRQVMKASIAYSKKISQSPM